MDADQVRALIQRQSYLRGLTFKDDAITKELEAIYRALSGAAALAQEAA